MGHDQVQALAAGPCRRMPLQYTAPSPRRSAMPAIEPSSDPADQIALPVENPGQSRVRHDDRALLAGFELDVDSAWRAFLQRYATPMLRWLQRREDDVDAAHDRWLEVCERLCADRCARLRQVRLHEQQPCLWPWLMTVMNHGVINALWARIGRARVPAKVRALGDAASHLYAAMVHTGGAALTCIEAAAMRYPGIETSAWLLAWEELQAVLNAADRGWIASYYVRRHGAEDLVEVFDSLAAEDDPQDWTERSQVAARLGRGLALLSARQRLALQLRFEQELPHASIGALIGTGGSGARHVLREALAQLAQHMNPEAQR